MTPFLAIFRAAALFLFLGVAAATAQTTSPNFEDWERVAQRAEEAVESASASSDAFEELRADVAEYREQWLQIQNAGDPRLGTLQSQLDALGPVPEDGTEPPEISQRRAELTEQIAALRAPLQRAEEAFTRADGLVAEIDGIIRSRQTDALLERGEEPIDPRLWPAALTEVGETLHEFRVEIRDNWRNEVRRSEFVDALPAILLTLIVALGLVLRAPALIDRLGEWLRDKTRRGTGVWTTVLSLVRVFVPVFGLALVVGAVDVTGIFGPLGFAMVELLPTVLFVMLFTQWLAEQRFSLDENLQEMALAPELRTEAKYYANSLAWLLAFEILVSQLGNSGTWSAATVAVMVFPIHVLCGLLLFRLGQILRRVGVLEDNDGESSDELIETSQFVVRLARIAGTAAMAVGIVGPLLSAIGYFNLAEALIFPTILSLGLFAVLLTLQNFTRDLYRLVTGRELDNDNSLIPVITGIILILAALPVLALIWGARVADLTEIWARFQEGFSFGETRISPIDFLTFAVVFAIGYIATRLLQGGLRGSVLPKTRIDKGGQTAIVSGTGYVGIFLSAIVAITAAGIDLSALALVAGALSVGIGFGLQNIVQNFVSGIILLIERPISEGDWIEVNGQQGTVRDISVRSTRIETFDRTDVIVPNADLVSNSVTNFTRGNVLGRLVVDVGVAYGTDTRKVEEILYKIARNHDMVLMNPAPFVLFKGFGADSLDFDVRMILRDVTQILAVRNEVTHQINEAFVAEGIEIPFAQRDVWLRNPEALSAAPKAAEMSPADADKQTTPTSDPTEDAVSADAAEVARDTSSTDD